MKEDEKLGKLFVALREKGKTMLSLMLGDKNEQLIMKKSSNLKPLDIPPIWRERDINRWLKEEFFSRGKGSRQGGLRFIRFVSVEFEEKKLVRLVVMTNLFIRLYIDTELSDLWHDCRTSSVSLALKSIRLTGVPLLPQFLSRWLTQLCMSIAGFIFNPISLNKGTVVRLNADSIRFDFYDYFRGCEHSGVCRYLRDEGGECKSDFIIFGADTYRGGITPQIHKLSDEAQQKFQLRKSYSLSYDKSMRFKFSDIWQLSLVAAVAFITVILVRPSGIPEVSLSWSFLTSLLVLFISMSLINLARWIYQFYWQSKRRFIVFRAEEMRYRIDRIKRDVELEMDRFRQEVNDAQLESDLFRAGLHRFKVLMLQERIEKFSREIKLKYVVVYVITIISEYVAFHYFG